MSEATPTRRPTRQRLALTEALTGIDEFVSAQQLHARMTASGSKVGLATVYRNLQSLAADGEVDVLRTDEGEALYRACSTEAHHHHLVCRECGRTVEVSVPASFEQWSARVGAEHGFTRISHLVEIFGVCSDH
jgi:Fur family ferric uptake transcriptional regulator